MLCHRDQRVKSDENFDDAKLYTEVGNNGDQDR